MWLQVLSHCQWSRKILVTIFAILGLLALLLVLTAPSPVLQSTHRWMLRLGGDQMVNSSAHIYVGKVIDFPSVESTSAVDATRTKNATGASKSAVNATINNQSHIFTIDDIGVRYRDGKNFSFSPSELKSLGIPPTEFTTLKGSYLTDFVFATGTSANHFTEAYDAIASVQKHFPGRKIIFYDLGLFPNQTTKFNRPGVNEEGSNGTFCDVEYRFFNFSEYPSHVGKNLRYCVWKWLVVKDILSKYPGVLWLDASIRFRTNKTDVYRKRLEEGHGVMMFTSTGHSNYAVTDPKMYAYLPTDVNKQKHIEQWQAGGILVYNTREVYTNFLHWAYLCALTADCISPVDALKCVFKGSAFTNRAGCHRYDQAMVNLLLANWHGSVGGYTAGSHKNELFSVDRKPTSKYEVQYCKHTKIK